MSRGIEAFVEERRHQIEDKGCYTLEHDVEHGSEVLLRMAACYADYAATDLQGSGQDVPHPFWPIEPEAWNPGNSTFEMMEKSAALMAAAYDTLWAESSPGAF